MFVINPQNKFDFLWWLITFLFAVDKTSVDGGEIGLLDDIDTFQLFKYI